MKKLTEQQAFDAMRLFVERHYRRTGSDDFGAFLGDLEALRDGTALDPAAREEWRECVAEVISNKVAAAE